MTPNDLGKSFLVEECSKIKIEEFLKQCRSGLKEHILHSEVEASGWKLGLTSSKTAYNGTRLWFKCPICEFRAGVVFRHPLTGVMGCRKCLKLEYRKRRYKGMVESTGLS